MFLCYFICYFVQKAGCFVILNAILSKKHDFLSFQIIFRSKSMLFGDFECYVVLKVCFFVIFTVISV